ncbi:MAG: DUF1295 domain-containing protein [Candidatus Aminicenantes bacterium]|nr:DUF1295 domain-containing protein [Candidatus Aminicenantes bacterium]
MNKNDVLYFFKMGMTLIIGAAALFLTAGRLDWWPAWVYIGISLNNQCFVFFYLRKKNPELLKERTQGPKSAKKWDRPLVAVQGALGPLSISILSGLDERFSWSFVPNILQFIGFIVCLLASVLALWAVAVNPFFSALVRLQKDRSHRVISSGPYRFVRHPGYLGAVCFTLALPLLLGSLWAYVFAFLTVVIIFLRTVKEDQTLKQELDGYSNYSQKVPYRLFPGLW